MDSKSNIDSRTLKSNIDSTSKALSQSSIPSPYIIPYKLITTCRMRLTGMPKKTKQRPIHFFTNQSQLTR